MKPKTKNGTKGAAKSPAKTKGKDQGARPSSSPSASTGAAAPVAADAAFTDSPLLPSELRTRAAWDGILGRGAFFAQRIVTEWGDDWRSFEELARDVASGAVVPPTAAEWSAFARRQMAEMDRETAYFDALEANDEKTARKIEKAGVFGECKMPETWARFDVARNAMFVYFWFYQLAEVRHVPDPVLSEIVQDASRGFARYRDAATERGRLEADKLFGDAMRYLERRLAQLLSDTEGRAAALSPAWDAVRSLGRVVAPAVPVVPERTGSLPSRTGKKSRSGSARPAWNPATHFTMIEDFCGDLRAAREGSFSADGSPENKLPEEMTEAARALTRDGRMIDGRGARGCEVDGKRGLAAVFHVFAKWVQSPAKREKWQRVQTAVKTLDDFRSLLESMRDRTRK